MANNYAIAVRNCSKSFSTDTSASHLIFEEFNLTLPQGSIYVILGPSSCGKTTLIRAILGRISIDKGDIFMLGQKINGTFSEQVSSSDVGYMPQDTCLHDMLTISETITLYGGIHGLSKKVIKDRMDFYITFLRLPSKHSIIKNLSGGEKRRVSFAASMVHQPKLIILDEPTVGLDPIVRQSIWQHFNKLVSTTSVSILMTTHFVEEARNASIVGMWHKRRLQVEGPPNLILSSLNSNTLEDSFYRICSVAEIQSEREAASDHTIDTRTLDLLETLAPRTDEILPNMIRVNVPDGVYKSRCASSFNRVSALIQKNTVQFCRFPVALLFLIALPPLTMLAFCTAFGNLKGLGLAVRTADEGPYGKLYFELFDPEIFKQTVVTSFEEGRNAVLSGQQLSFIDVEYNFSSNFVDLLTSDVRSIKNNTDGRLENLAVINLNGIDYPHNIFVKFQSVFHLEKLCFIIANHSRVSQRFCVPPLKLDRTVNNVDITDTPFRMFFIPGFLIICSYFVAFPCAVLSFFLEKRNGYLERGYIAGLSTLETITGYVLITAFIVVLQIVGIILVAFVMYDAPLKGSIMLLFIFLLWTAVGGMSTGFMLSSMTKDLYLVCILSFGWLFFSIPLSGWFWPLSAMPKVMRLLSYTTPFAIQIQAIIGIMNHGWGFMNQYVLTAFAVTTAWLPILNGLTFYMLKSRHL